MTPVTRFADEPIEGPYAWTVEEPDIYDFLARQDPPRSGSFLRALKVDARNWQVIQFWSIGFVLSGIGLGVVYYGAKTSSWGLAVPGLVLMLMGGRVVVTYLRLLFRFIRTLRSGRLLRGQIPSLGRTSVVRGYSTVKARLSDGRSLLVSVRIAPALALLGDGAPAEVIILAGADERDGMVICIRALERNRAEAESLPPSK
jgi:hypothetical protein